MSELEEYEVLIEFVCPFCTKDCQAIREVKTDKQALVHVQPACHKFLTLEPDAFMHEVNGEYRKKVMN